MGTDLIPEINKIKLENQFGAREFFAGVLKRSGKSLPKFCTLCGRNPAHSWGVFLPDEAFSRSRGVGASRSLMMFYTACYRCLKLPNIDALMDAHIRRAPDERILKIVIG